MDSEDERKSKRVEKMARRKRLDFPSPHYLPWVSEDETRLVQKVKR